MHFTWDVTLGQVVISVPIAWGVLLLLRMNRMLLSFRIEHEILMRFWASKQEPVAKLEDLPTRQTRWW